MTEIIKKLELKREEIAIGALLHDIGKFIMRKEGGKNGTHQLYGYKYLKEITNEEIAQYALKHHESEKEELNAVKAGLDKWIVCYADNLSSGERNPYTNEYDKKVWDPEVSIKNIFSIILNSKDFYDNPMEKLPENPVNEKIP
ncbi:MAG: HD domain-containing protein, partial [Candidatus Muiribacteriota bacterium]